MAEKRNFPEHPILLVDDEEYIIKTITRILRSAGYNNIESRTDGRNVLTMLRERMVEIILLDLTMPHVNGLTLLGELYEKYPEIPVIIITGTDEIDTAITCMKSGAVDYFVKPVEENRLISSIKKSLSSRKLKRDYDKLKKQFLHGEIQHPDIFSSIITRSREMQNIFIYLETIAKSNEPVLISGETGTGKELIAEAVHRASGKSGPFIRLNIAGLDDTMFSDTLFGHKKGSFTGAAETRRGLIEQAADGTLFLDEIGDTPFASQIKLLRLLENREYYPLGSDMPKRSNARIVFATNRDANSLVEEGLMRKDFFYRISTHAIRIPPLRERLEDLPLLIDYFTTAAAEEYKKPVPNIPREAYPVLRSYNFPGNIRELRSIIFDAVSRTGGTLLNTEFLKHFGSGRTEDGAVHAETASVCIFPANLPSLKEVNELLINEALQRTEGNQAKAAVLLGITPQALSKRLKNQL
jgi:DNA-binding NtrC family response regulator